MWKNGIDKIGNTLHSTLQTKPRFEGKLLPLNDTVQYVDLSFFDVRVFPKR